MVLIGFVVSAFSAWEILIVKAQFPRATILAVTIGVFMSFLIQYLRNECIFQTIIDEASANYHGVEALLYTYSFLNPRFPLPKTRGWAASPDFLNIVIERIIVHKPKTVVEFGAGASTVVIGYALEKNSQGKLYSFDNYKEYLEVFQKVVACHGLKDRVTLIHAPLTKNVVKGKAWTYYAPESIKAIAEIDMLIVDGPSGRVQSNARYPAIPLLFDKLASGAIVIVDDYNRRDDRDTVEMWLKEYPKMKLLEESFTEKGTAVLVKIS